MKHDVCEMHEKMINGVFYVFLYENDCISFYVDPVRSLKKVDFGDDDPFDWDPAPKSLWGRVDNDNVFDVMRSVSNFIEMVIGKHKPYYFRYDAIEKSRLSLYERYARRLSNRFGYSYKVEDHDGARSFVFMKNGC